MEDLHSMIDERLLEIRSFEGTGFQPLIDYDKWRIAMLRYSEELLPERLFAMQRHNETDEVFVLLEGRCILLLGDRKDTITSITAVNMVPRKLYNIRRGVWHNHTLSLDASVLVVENSDTTVQNSPRMLLNDNQRSRIVEITHELWQE
jgi:ureidoglycolate hydrolase